MPSRDRLQFACASPSVYALITAPSEIYPGILGNLHISVVDEVTRRLGPGLASKLPLGVSDDADYVYVDVPEAALGDEDFMEQLGHFALRRLAAFTSLGIASTVPRGLLELQRVVLGAVQEQKWAGLIVIDDRSNDRLTLSSSAELFALLAQQGCTFHFQFERASPSLPDQVRLLPPGCVRGVASVAAGNHQALEQLLGAPDQCMESLGFTEFELRWLDQSWLRKGLRRLGLTLLEITINLPELFEALSHLEALEHLRLEYEPRSFQHEMPEDPPQCTALKTLELVNIAGRPEDPEGLVAYVPYRVMPHLSTLHVYSQMYCLACDTILEFDLANLLLSCPFLDELSFRFLYIPMLHMDLGAVGIIFSDSSGLCADFLPRFVLRQMPARNSERLRIAYTLRDLQRRARLRQNQELKVAGMQTSMGHGEDRGGSNGEEPSSGARKQEIADGPSDQPWVPVSMSDATGGWRVLFEGMRAAVSREIAAGGGGAEEWDSEAQMEHEGGSSDSNSDSDSDALSNRAENGSLAYERTVGEECYRLLTTSQMALPDADLERKTSGVPRLDETDFKPGPLRGWTHAVI